ncbi:hypothetical protein KSP39_PZI011805 [Platanthera zijinensis]|uniref:Uncharacterized protein n=1 Tax=Platanthera zijinensis TaxID=2320716 RepID=A0AAP0BFG5_9ASPA
MRRRYDAESRLNKRRSSARLVARRMAAMTAEEVKSNLNLDLTLAVGGDDDQLDLSLKL